jgi:hypothetical protein
MPRQGQDYPGSINEIARAVFGSTKSILNWTAGVLVAAAIAVLSLIFVFDIYITLQQPEPTPIQRR